MFHHRSMIQLAFVFGLLSLSGGWAVAQKSAENPSPAAILQRWDTGLTLLDAGKTTEAATYFHDQMRSFSGNLIFLEAWFRAVECHTHADSVLVILGNEMGQTMGSWTLAHRFSQALQLRESGDYAAAVDSFQAVAGDCADLGDPLSAVICRHRAAGCRIDNQDAQLGSTIVEDLDRSNSSIPFHARLDLEAQVLIAHAHFLQDDFFLAEKEYRSALSLANKRGFFTSRCDILNALGSVMSKQRRLDESLDFYGQAVEAARQIRNRLRLCLILANQGYACTHLRDFDQARTHLYEADALARKWGYSRSLGSIVAGLGAIAEMSGDRVAAVDHFRQAVDMSRQSGNIFIELGSRQRMAYNLAMMGSYAEAMQHYEKCLETLKQRGGKYILNWVYGGLAVTNHKLGYLDQAVEYYRKAQAVNLEMGDRMSAAWCLNSLGAIQGLQGHYRQALVTHRQALEEYEDMDDKEGAGEARSSIAEVYFQLGNYHQALKYCREAMAIAEQTNAEELLRRASQTTAAIHAATGKPELAAELYLNVLKIARKWDDLVVEIWALNGLAEQYLALGNTEGARDELLVALDLMGDREYFHVRSETCRLLGGASVSNSEAIGWAKQAVSLAESGGLPEHQWKALSDLGLYRSRQGEREAARQLLERALNLVESLRERAGTGDLQRHMLHPALQVYERLIALHLEAPGNPTAAFVVSERSRARILADRLNAGLSHNNLIPARETDPKERDLKATITFCQSCLQDPRLGKSARDSLRLKIAKLEDEFSLLKLRWLPEEQSDAMILFPQVPEVENLLQCLKPGEHLLSYFLGAGQSVLFSVNRAGVKAYTLPAQEILEEKIELFLGLEQSGTATGASLPEHVIMASRQKLYEILMQPAAGDFAADETLVLVPDGMLHRLDFAFLHDGRNYVFEDHEIFTAPSLQTLQFLRQKTEGMGESHGGRSRVVAIGCGDSGGGSDAEQERVNPYTGLPIPALAHADDEAWRLASLFDDAVILTGSAANEHNARSGILAGADIVHLATHSYADEIDPRRSYILLNRNPEDSEDDDLLLWHEILALNLNSSLVTLASCRSAAGMLARGEGVTGLTQAFLYAGSRCVLASLVDAQDKETRSFMDLFYHEFSLGYPAAKALRNARLAAWNQDSTGQGPLPGSGFILTGDGSITYGQSSASRPNPWWMMGPALLLVAAGLVFRRK